MMTGIVSFVGVFFLVFFPYSFAYGDLNQELKNELLKNNPDGILCDKEIKVEKNAQGKLVDTAPDDPKCQYTPLMKYLSGVLLQLNASMNSLDGVGQDGKDASNRLSRIYLIDESALPRNAFAAEVNQTNQVSNETPYVVGISTGLIKEIFSDLDPNKPLSEAHFQKNVTKLLAVLAHETAHRSSSYKRANSKHSWNPAEQQYEEIRADTIAHELLRRANLPSSGLYDLASGWVVSDEPHGAVGAAISTHPSGEFRASAARQL